MTERPAHISWNRTGSEADSGYFSRLPNFYDVVPVGLGLIDPDLRFASINRRLAEMTGRPAEEDLGRTLAEVVPGVAAQLEPHLRRALQGEPVADLELQGTILGGICDGRIYLVCLEPARSNDGSVVGVLCSALDITARKRAEEALRDSQKRLSNLVEQAAVGIVQTDLDGHLVLVNDRFCEIIGQKRDQILGQRMQDITHPDDKRGNMVLFKRLVETGEPFSVEKRYVRPDGSVVWVKNYVSATGDAFGRPEFLIAIVQDISERKQAEAAQRESEDHYRHTVELSPHIPWAADPDGNLVEVSPRACAVLGVPLENLVGRGWSNNVHPDDWPGVAKIWTAALASGALYDAEFRFRQADGAYRWVRSRAAPHRNAQDRIIRWYGTLEDVHDRRLAAEAQAETEIAFRQLFHSNPAPMWIYDQETLRFLEVNAAAVQTYGWSREAFLSMSILDIRPAEDREAVLRSAAQSRAARKVSGPWRHIDVTGCERLVEAMSYLLDFAGRPAVLVTAWDVTNRVRAESALRESEENYRYTVELSQQIPWVADADGQILSVNYRLQQLAGLPEEKALGMGWLVAIHPEDVSGMEACWTRSITSGEPLSMDFRLRLRDGNYRWFHSRAAARRDETGRVIRWYGTTEDIHERKLADQQIAFLAYHDPLTDLPNRRLFHQKLEHALAHQSTGEFLALHFVDLDQFKGVNDTLGHVAGDALLRQVADRLRHHLPADGVLARLGGDEFAIIQTGLHGPEDAAALAQHIVEVLDEEYLVDDHRAVVGASIGISLVSHEGALSDDVIRNADIALYRAKADGRATFRFFEPSMEKAVQRKQELRAGLRTALDRDELALDFQPLVGIRVNEVTCFEALLRWKHPVHGMITPTEFIPVAEETGLIMRMGEWALRSACCEAAHWPQTIRVAVNLSPVQFRNPGLMQVVTGALSYSGLDAGRLELEITESVLLQDDQTNFATLWELRQLGVRIALDDFGTGFSSLSYLLRFPFDKIKIDRSFVTGLPDRTESKAVIRAVVSMSRSLGISVTAEGVETAGQLDALRRLGCNDVQGYLFSRPVPAAEVAALINRLHTLDGLVA